MATCKEPALNARIAELCLGEADGHERSTLEAHLLVCDECWTEFQRINEAVHVIRSDKTDLEPVTAADFIQLVGLGAQLHRWLGGHAVITVAISIGFGLMMALALLVEVAYQWTTYRQWALYVSVIIGVESAAVSLLSFDLMRRRLIASRTNAIVFALGPLVAWAVCVALTMAPFLSADPTVLASFQTMTARIGWMKSVGQALQIPLLSLLPFHFVLAMQHELRSNRIDRVLKLLTNDPMRVTPRGTLYVRPVLAAAVFVLFAAWWIIGSAHLLENLRISRMMVVLLSLFAVLIWYARSLNDIKREAIAILAGRKVLGPN
jgi:hypothetical protein